MADPHRSTAQALPPMLWEVDAMPELAPWLDIVAQANGIAFFNWHVRADRLTWNPGAEERMGLPAGGLGSLGQWYRSLVPEDARRVVAEATRRIATRAMVLQFQYRLRSPADRPRVMEAIGHCIYDDDGQLTRIMGAVRDITDGVEIARDLHHLQGQFLRRARLDALGAVAAGLAHELNQPLSAAANYLGAARLEAASAGGKTMLANADRAADQIELAGDIIRRLRAFLSDEDRLCEWLPAATLVEEAMFLALPGLRRSADVTVNVDPDLRLFGDRIHIQQLLVNVLHNAVTAMESVPRRRREVIIAGARHAEQVELTVSDSGPGFSAETLKAFELTPPLMEQGHGLGFGLSLCRHIMNEQGGSLSLENRPEGGAMIRFTFIDPVEDQE